MERTERPGTGDRRRPRPGDLLLLAAAVGTGLSVASHWWALPTAVAAFLAGRRPGRTVAAALTLAAVVVAAVPAALLVPSWLALGSVFVAVVVLAAMLPWFAGRFWWQYRELVRAGWERAAHLEREQRLVAEQARLRERARIAQDMHDVLGHDLSLIALSAGALKLAPGLAEEHRATAHDIRARAAAAVERLGEVVGVLREGTDAPPRTTPDTSLAGLVAAAAAAGLPVELRGEDPHPHGEAVLPPLVGRAAHRVVQEALTNVAKHAPGAPTTVHVSRTRTDTRIRVRNGPAAAPSAARLPSGGGHGLVGLDERVRHAGGTLRYGPEHGGGFTVEARLPHTPPSGPPRPTEDEPGAVLPREHHRARRRTALALAAAVVVPLASGALLTGALVGWESLTAADAVLEPGDYARLRIGQDRSEVERVLPDRQLVSRPVVPEPEGEGIACEYYAMTAERFDDRSGDTYRLCFRDGLLVAKDALTPAP
ncbi:sensor histidine kinase [Streptomyces coeruleoprunus]|uniref:histidine kinase n=1 Tax=Streptomyces coeruleoprunus TaxID=285563 RepID=A0ABV9XKM3_9ACTN